MKLNWGNAVLALSLIRFGQELGCGGRLSPLVADAIDVVLRLLGGTR